MFNLGSKITVKKMLQKVYPVGSIYMSTASTSPATLFGFGTWEQIQDRFLLAAGSTYTAGATGGAATHTLTKDELPNISGSLGLVVAVQGTSGSTEQYGLWGTGEFKESTVVENHRVVTSSTVVNSNAKRLTLNVGNSQSHNNMPPYLTVYVWKRTA